MADGGTIGADELARMVQSMTKAIEELRLDIKGLSDQYTPREVHDLALGGVKIDIRRIDEQHSADSTKLHATAATLKTQVDQTAKDLDHRLNEQERETARRFRQSVLLIFSAVLAPLTIALVIYVLTSLQKVSA